MRDPGRLIDANSNRAAEAARTIEDLARFVLDDGPLAARAKRCRHQIESLLSAAGFDRLSRAQHRDTPGDAGVANSRQDSHERSGPAEIGAAASARLAEALRVLEEAVKLSNSGVAAQIEALRYEAYETERRLLRRLTVPKLQWRLCLLLTESLCTHHDWQTVLRESLAGGVDCVQVREKFLSDRELLGRVRGVIEIARNQGAAVVVNDRPDIAAICGADGLHLGQTDLPIAEARRIAGPACRIGVSCSTLRQAIDAANAGADTLGIGAMYESATKPKPDIAGPGLLAAVLADPDARDVPHLAIGGIDADRARELASLGCQGVAVSRAVCAAEDPEAAAAAVRQALDSSTAVPGATT